MGLIKINWDRVEDRLDDAPFLIVLSFMIISIAVGATLLVGLVAALVLVFEHLPGFVLWGLVFVGGVFVMRWWTLFLIRLIKPDRNAS